MTDRLFPNQTIAVFRGPTQYEAGGAFLERLSDAWRTDGHVVVDLPAGPGLPPALRTAIEGGASLFFGYNGVGASLAPGGTPLYERIGATYVAWLVDHPVHHAERLASAPAGAVVLSVDAEHPDDVARLAPQIRSRGWLPHFGCPAPGDPPAERDIAVLVPGTVRASATIRAGWAGRGSAYRDACERAMALLGSAACGPLDAARTALAGVATMAGPDALRLAILVAREADLALRAARRERVLERLTALGITATVCGAADPGARGLAGHTWHGPLPFDDMLQLMARARVVVDTGAAFRAGGHERGLSALVNGAVACVERTRFWRSLGSDVLVDFEWGDDQLLADLPGLLADPRRLEAIAERGAAASRPHSAAARARTVLEHAGAAAATAGAS